MVLFLLIIPFFAFMVLVGGMYRREIIEKEDSGHTHCDQMYDKEEEFEGEEDEEGIEMQGGEFVMRPLCKLATKLREGEVVEPSSLYSLMIVMEKNLTMVHTPVSRSIFVE